MDKQRRNFLRKRVRRASSRSPQALRRRNHRLRRAAGPGASPGSPAAPKRMTFVTCAAATPTAGREDRPRHSRGDQTAKFLRSPAPTHDRGSHPPRRPGTHRARQGCARAQDPGVLRLGRPRRVRTVRDQSEKILCVGLNYARHARETNNPIPKLPILFKQVQQRAQQPRRHGEGIVDCRERFDYESELVIVMGKKARNVSEAEALSYVFGYCNGNDFTARDLPVAEQPVDDRQDLRRLRPARAYLVTADQVDPNNLKIEGNGKRRGTPVLEHQRHGVQLRTDRQLTPRR